MSAFLFSQIFVELTLNKLSINEEQKADISILITHYLLLITYYFRAAALVFSLDLQTLFLSDINNYFR
ncbi:hypothetical protein Xen7305DRAFT_00047990 [Xenococcus sp. PCC 7305]|nr:hypothetical protein Xen7305DRAFT_00047990 [Xenococcus sp. PCC 7305]